MEDKDRIEIYAKQLDRVLGFFSRVEGKASFIFALNSALLTLIAVNLQREDLTKWWITVPAALAVLLIVGSFYYVYRCLFPALKGGNNSLLYFREIAKRREAEYLDLLAAVTPEQLVRDLAGQIWRNAEILTTKYDAIKFSFVLTAIALIPWFIFLVGVSFAHPLLPTLK